MPTLIISSNPNAALEFARLWQAVCGEELQISASDDGVSDLVLIGSDASNPVTARLMLDGRLPRFSLRYGTDDYIIRSNTLDGRRLLVLAGGRIRSDFYALYDYFERAAGCRWFWDGDIVPAGGAPSLDGWDIAESPRFEYRGLRYFAHRSLHRFQAEHWSLDDWKREIDWMLKKRLNMFMLRIGMDDLFQKAFPEIVDYPAKDEKLPEAGPGYDDRTTFWPLQYRGQLRHDLLEYAFARDIIHPEDCGTMTHWYSRTPIQYLEKAKPGLLIQSTKGYSEATGLVWDIFDDENLNNYFKLTKAHIEHYGRPDIFHTIGFAERRYSDDDEVNLRLKLYIYRRIARFLKENYPNAPLFIASWDLWFKYKPEEVKRLTAELDPNQSIILDYTSDTELDNNFTNWGVVGKFPYVFGIFHGFEPDSDIRGDYALTDKRLEVADNDAMCKGLIFWPELSHSDTFMTEYLSDNAWKPLKYSLDERIDRYCDDRYVHEREKMRSVWHVFMPIASLNHWSKKEGCMRSDMFFNLKTTMRIPSVYKFSADYADVLRSRIDQTADMLRTLAETDITADEFIRRDAYDILRTTCGRYINLGISDIITKINACRQNGTFAPEAKPICDLLDVTECMLDLLCDILAGHEDYSMYETLEGLKKVTYVNPLFEETLKNNASCGYCRSYIYENARYLYLEEFHAIADSIRAAVNADNIEYTTAADTELNDKLKEVTERYFAVSLYDMRPKRVQSLAYCAGQLAKFAERYCNR